MEPEMNFLRMDRHQTAENRRNAMIITIRRALRRLDSWTVEVFNPRYPFGHR
jgi:hypothetical protein